ncbi:alpha/beta fold hydrolase [Kitasatospora sp. NPDC096147]|uniref:alpha/beta fold hydrolase n=1 Tax=Kitasatospora sp. NPDC096147 TaxID=3364093 RepID=UPI0038078E0F
MTTDQNLLVPVPGGELFSTRTGAGPDLVLLDAGSVDLRMWEGNLPTLTPHHRVTRYDDRPVGRRSSRATTHWSFTGDLPAVLDTHGIGRATLVGASDGGRKALDFAVAHPERVERLVLVGTATELPDPTPAERADLDAVLAALLPRTEAVERGDLAAAALIDLDVRAPRADPAARARPAELYADSPDFLLGTPAEPLSPARPGIARPAEVTAPTLAVVGEHDIPFARRCAARIAAGVPGAELVTVPGGDHFLDFSRPDRFAALVLGPR